MIAAGMLARYLKASGTSSVFALGGESHFRVLAALADEGVNVVSTHTENGAIGAADGYARVSGRPGVALIVAEQGVPNGLAALITAARAGVPVVVLAARRPVTHAEEVHGAFGDVIRGVAASVCKHVRTVTTADALVPELSLAFAAAVSGRPGPALLFVPTDVLGAATRVSATPGVMVARPEASAAAVEVVADMLAGAERPVVVVGNEARWSDDLSAIAELCRRYGFPALGDGLGRGVVPEDLTTGFPLRVALDCCADADMVLSLGAELHPKTGFGEPGWLDGAAAVALVGAEPHRARVPRDIDVAVGADPGRFARQLVPVLRRRNIRSQGTRWVRAALGAKLDETARRKRVATRGLHPACIADVVAEKARNNAIVVVDGANIFGWCCAVARMTAPHSWLDHQPFGSMGVGVTLALGAAVASREHGERENVAPREVVLVAGDGAFGYHVMECASLVQAELAVTILVSNDGGWGAERDAQRQLIGRNVNVDFSEISYASMCEGLGCLAVRVTEEAELRHAVAQQATAQRVMVVDAVVDRNAPAANVVKFAPRMRHAVEP